MSEPAHVDTSSFNREMSSRDRGQSATSGGAMNRLPMYDVLVARLNERVTAQPFPIDHNYMVKLSAVLNSLGTDQAEQVALLLIHHYFLSNPSGPSPFVPKTTSRGSGSRLPYEIKMSAGKGFSFDPASLVPAFQALLGTFCAL